MNHAKSAAKTTKNATETFLEYLLLPSPPTPNGRLHLGHIGGPYLRMDILKRGVQMLGHSAHIVLTLDSYESFVMLASKQNHCSVEDTIAHFSKLIDQDLKSVGVDAVIINPLDSKWNETYRNFSNRAVKTLVDTGKTSVKEELYYYSNTSSNDGSKKCISGTWLIGTCPTCGAQVSGDCCDGCSAIIKPQTLLNAHARFDEGSLTQRRKPVLYFDVIDVDATINQIKIASKHKKTIAEQWARANNKIRLSVPALSWGLDLTAIESLKDSHVFSYSSLGLYLTSGEYVASTRTDSLNPFANKDARIVMGFGIDNLIHMSYINTLMIQSGYRGFNWTLPTYFMALSGEKFSTSANHAIWAGKFVSDTGIFVDDLRYYLSSISPEHQQTNFSLGEMVKTTDVFYSRFSYAIEQAWTQLNEVTAIDNHLNDDDIPQHQQLIETLYSEQEFSLLKIVEHLNELFKQPCATSKDALNWLLELTLVIYPVMPETGRRLWLSLGFKSDTPSIFELSWDVNPLGKYRHQSPTNLDLNKYNEFL